jgi:soluble lytic murein transglycosylase-like protein
MAPTPIEPVTGEARYQAVRVLAKKWAAVWHVDYRWILAFSAVESGHRPNATCNNERARLVGGAWGLLQITGDTSHTIVNKIRSFATRRPEFIEHVKTILPRWNSQNPSCMLDPERNVMFGSFYLAELAALWSALALVAAAYHQGPGAVARLLKAGLAIPDDLPPNGRIYVARIVEAFRLIHAREAKPVGGPTS